MDGPASVSDVIPDFWHPPGSRPSVCVDGRTLTLRFDSRSIQSVMHLDDPARLELEYTRAMMLFLLIQPAPRSMLMVGLGGGSLPRYCHRHLPETDITVVEIDPAVIALRERFLVPPDGPRFRVRREDGAEHMRQAPDRYDVILLDGFDADGQPAALATRDFYDACRLALRAGGVLVVNFDGDPAVSDPLLARLESAFDGGVRCVRTENGGNRVALAATAVQLREARRHARRRLAALAPVHRETLGRGAGAQAGWPVLV